MTSTSSSAERSAEPSSLVNVSKALRSDSGRSPREVAVEQAPRKRRAVETARLEILNAAQRLLVAGGPDAVKVKVIAKEIGVTDAAVHYHFGSREGLLEALLAHCGREMKKELSVAIERWDRDAFDLGELARILDDAFRRRAVGPLAMWMRVAGWRSRGQGMLRTHAEDIHHARVERARATGRPAPQLDDSLFTLSLLATVLWADSVAGDDWRRAVGLSGDAETRDRFRAWFVQLLGRHVGH